MDSDLRDSERNFLASGDVGAEAAWLRARLRQGELELRPLQTAAQLGYPAALAALGEEPGPPLGAPGDDLELLTRVTLAEAREVLEWGAVENERELLSLVDEIEANLLREEELITARELAELVFLASDPEPGSFPAYLTKLLPLLYQVQESEPRERPVALVALRAALADAEAIVPDYPPTASQPGPRRELARLLLGWPSPAQTSAEAPFLAALERYEESPREGYPQLVAAGQAKGWSFAGRTWSEWFQLLDSPRGGRSAGAAAALQRAARQGSNAAVVAALAAARLSTPLHEAPLRARVVTLSLAHLYGHPLPPQLGAALAPYLAHEDGDLREGALNLLEQLSDEDHDLHPLIAQILAREIRGARVLSIMTALELLGRSARGVAALEEVCESGRPALEFARALCGLRTTGDPDALDRLLAFCADPEFSEGRQGWLLNPALDALAERPAALLAAAPTLVSLIERADSHPYSARALELLLTLGDQLQPWLARLRAAAEGAEEEGVRADLLALLSSLPSS